MTVTTDEGIREVLTGTKTIALVGASSNPDRPSHAVMRYLIDRGYTVIPVYPREERILGQPVYRKVQEIPGGVDLVDVFRRREELPGVFDDALRAGAPAIWISPLSTRRSPVIASTSSVCPFP